MSLDICFRDDNFQHISGIKYAGPFRDNEVNYENETKSLMKSLILILNDATQMPSNKLTKDHEDSWHSVSVLRFIQFTNVTYF